MVNYRDLFKNLGWRAVIAGLVLGFGVYVISKALAAGGGLGSAGYLLVGMAVFVVAGIIMGMPLARLVAEFLGNLVYTSEHYGKPQPVYGIPEANRLKGLYQEAYDGFQKLSEEHPQELKAYIEMIDIAIVDLKNPDLASSAYDRGMESLKKEEAKELLSKRYRAIAAAMDHG
jgi:hypothetical protein